MFQSPAIATTPAKRVLVADAGTIGYVIHFLLSNLDGRRLGLQSRPWKGRVAHLISEALRWGHDPNSLVADASAPLYARTCLAFMVRDEEQA